MHLDTLCAIVVCAHPLPRGVKLGLQRGYVITRHQPLHLEMNPMLDCLMPSFQVYLPPRLVDLSVCSAADVPITFRKIPRSLSAESLSQPRSQGGSLLGRLLLGHGTKIEQDRKGKRRATELDLEQNDLPEASRVGGDAAVGPVPGPLNDGVDRYPLMSPTQESPRPPKHDIHQDLASPTGDANNHNEASRRERKRLKAAGRLDIYLTHPASHRMLMSQN